MCGCVLNSGIYGTQGLFARGLFHIEPINTVSAQLRKKFQYVCNYQILEFGGEVGISVGRGAV